MLFGLPQETIDVIVRLFEKYPEIEGVKIYGSRARGNDEQGSDIDFAIYQSGNRDLTGQLLSELDELPTPYLFDVLDYRTLKHLPLKAEISKNGQWFYRQVK